MLFNNLTHFVALLAVATGSLANPLGPRDTSDSLNNLEARQLDLRCNNEDDFRGHADINPGAQGRGAITACFDTSLPAQWNPSTPPFHRRTTSQGVNYDWSIRWEPGCQRDPQNVHFPDGFGGPHCTRLMWDNFEKCKSSACNG